jgi:hypothetical protein
LGVRVKYLLKPDAAGLKVAALASLFNLRSSTLTLALSRRERVIYTSRCRLMPMPPAPLRDGEGRRKMRSEKTTDLVKDAVGMVQDQMVGQTKDD